MASIRKVRGKWYAEVRIKGRYASKIFPSKMEAKSWSLEKEHEFGRSETVVRGKTLGDAFKRYAREISPEKKGSRWETIRLEKFGRDEIADKLLTLLNLDDIECWIKRSSETLAPGSVRREMTLLKSVCAQCIRWKWLPKNPCHGVRLPPPPPGRDRRISNEEVEKILTHLDFSIEKKVSKLKHEVAVAFLIALETAMRKGELWSLTWEDVYLERRFVHLPVTKNGSKRDVPLSARAIELFRLLGPDNDGCVFKGSKASSDPIFRRAVKKAGIENLTFHDSRHEALTRLSKKIDVLDLARMVGHKDLKSLMIYYNATAEEIARLL
ncbi:site-specific integrase [Emcibacter sp.]|uniref:tyrosine-type recombinase/integrase n=1 Tax=Emcibacter sp. TaxID=1979954 RepID=UPI002AA5F0DC|nr:site-specific integrase [Emcibacter sp.]